MAVVCSFCGGDVVEDREITCVMAGGNPCPACEERANIRDQIKQLEEEILKLKAKHHALGTTMNAIHDPFIHKLPSELASNIFELSLPIREIHSEPVQKLLLRTLKLGAVCRRWRQLAWSTPDLWAILFLNIGPSSPLLESLPGLIEDWLERSGALPLTIFFHQHDGYSERSSAYEFAIKRIIAAMNLHSSRWRNLYLDVAADIPGRLSGSKHRNQLFRLDLAINGGRSKTQNFTMKSKPFPAHLTLRNLSPTSINIGWDNVTRAAVYSLTANECVEILRRAPALEHLCASIKHSDDPTVNGDAFTVHPRIRSLNLLDKAKKFLLVISVPSLEEWTHCSTGVRLPVSAMVSLLKRSGCSLKILNLQQISSNSNNLSVLFQAMPSLERLQIHFRQSSKHCNDEMDDILGRIFRSPPDDNITPPADTNHEIFLPRLQFLECTAESGSYTHTPIAWDRVPQFYRQGPRPSLTLKSVANTFQTTNETTLELLNIVDEGAKFLISDNFVGGDFLANFRKRMGTEGSRS